MPTTLKPAGQTTLPNLPFLKGTGPLNGFEINAMEYALKWTKEQTLGAKLGNGHAMDSWFRILRQQIRGMNNGEANTLRQAFNRSRSSGSTLASFVEEHLSPMLEDVLSTHRRPHRDAITAAKKYGLSDQDNGNQPARAGNKGITRY